MDKKRIVILGGGFGGVRAALDLSNHVYKDADVVLVDKNGYHQYHPNFYRIATTFLPESRLVRPESYEELRDAVSLSLRDVIDEKKIRFLQEEVTSIDVKNQMVRFLSGNAISYNWLVLALGSVSNFFDIPGAEAHALPLKSAYDALQIRNAIDEIFASTPKHRIINIIISGAGLTGCELAVSLASYAKQLARVHPHPASNIRITLIEAADSILRDIRPCIRKKVEKRLETLGVRSMVKSRITEVTSQTIQGEEIIIREDHPLKKRSSNDPKEFFTLPYSILIWTAGVKAHPLTESIAGAKRNIKSCLVVDDYLRVSPFENIFAIGDVAGCMSAFSDSFLPMTAQVAISQGRYVAFTLKRILHKKMMFRYHEKRSRFVIPLGPHYAIADLGPIVLTGRLGWWLKRFITWDYLTGILSFRKAFKRWRTSHRER